MTSVFGDILYLEESRKELLKPKINDILSWNWFSIPIPYDNAFFQLEVLQACVK